MANPEHLAILTQGVEQLMSKKSQQPRQRAPKIPGAGWRQKQGDVRAPERRPTPQRRPGTGKRGG